MVLFGAVLSQTSGNPRAKTSGLALPLAGRVYHGVFPGTFNTNEEKMKPSDLEAYEQAVGRKAAWVYITNNWHSSRAFPAQTAGWIRARGAIPYIRLMLRSSSNDETSEPTYTLEAIRRGDFDAYLQAWAQAAQTFGSPLLVEWGTEMNGQWFPWNAKWNGETGGAKAFRESYRHIVKQMERANNLIWVWHIAANDDPAVDWNRFENYYPGNDAVDWIGVSVYGGQSPIDEQWIGFTRQMDSVIARLNKLAPTKPVVVAEFGASAGNPRGHPAQWAEQALSKITEGRWPSVKGFAWWNAAWENDDFSDHNTEMRVQKIPELAAVFRKYLALPQVLDKPIFP